MPEKKTVQKAKAAKRAGKSDSTAAGEFVREEIHHVREGKHGARSAKQAIAIGLSKARRAGVKVKAPTKGTTSEKTRKAAKRDNESGDEKRKAPSRTRSAASKAALKREPKRAASHKALSTQAHKGASKRTAAERSASAKKAAATRARNAGKS